MYRSSCCITTSQSLRTNSRDRPFVFSVLSALQSTFFSKVTQARCRHSRLVNPEIRMELDGRLWILLGTMPWGQTFQFMNIYRFTTSNPIGQSEIWNTTGIWIKGQRNARIIMHGDLNCAHSGCRWGYTQPLNKFIVRFPYIGEADNKLDTFLTDTGEYSHVRKYYTWKGKSCQAALDHVVTWYYHLPPHVSRPSPQSHKCSTTTKLGHNSLTWTSQNILIQLALPPQISPSGSTLSFSKDTRMIGGSGSQIRSMVLWKGTPQAKHSRPHPSRARNNGQRSKMAAG